MAKYTTKGTVIKIDTGSGLVAIPQCETIGLPTKVAGEIEASDHDSTVKEFLGDLPEMQTFEVTVRHDPADAVHAYLDANVGNTEDFEIGIKGAAAPTENDVLTFSGVILGFAPAPHAHQGGVMMATLTVRPTAVTTTDSGA
jgi:hypothetical protein